MNYIIRKMHSYEYPLLDDFLYEAIFQRDENNLAPKSITQRPELMTKMIEHLKEAGYSKASLAVQKDYLCLMQI